MINAGPASHRADVDLVSGNFFTGLGVNAIAGRTIVPEDDRENAAPVAMVSYRYWERHLGLDPESVGRVIFANGHPLTIIGILQKAFLGIQPGYVPDLYLPIGQVGSVANKWMNRMDATLGGYKLWDDCARLRVSGVRLLPWIL
jgi:hypothetical protein